MDVVLSTLPGAVSSLWLNMSIIETESGIGIYPRLTPPFVLFIRYFSTKAPTHRINRTDRVSRPDRSSQPSKVKSQSGSGSVEGWFFGTAAAGVREAASGLPIAGLASFAALRDASSAGRGRGSGGNPETTGCAAGSAAIEGAGGGRLGVALCSNGTRPGGANSGGGSA